LLASQNNFLLLGNPKKLRDNSAAQNVTIFPCAIKPFSIKELFFFPPALSKKINSTTLFYSPYFNIPSGLKIPIYTTIHDIIFPDMPELTSRAGLFARMWFYKRAAKKSKKVFTVSNFSKSRIEHFLGTKTPVIVTGNAAQSYILQSSAVSKTKTIIFIGNIKKHKGLSCLLRAFFAARNAGLAHRLIIVGSKDNFRTKDSAVEKLLMNVDSAAVEFTGFIPNEKLKTLLAQAALLVQPSLYEGFGYPPLEAMMQGTRALITDIPVFKEVYGDFPVVFFHAGDSVDLKDKLMELLYNKEPETILLSGELKNRYSFEKTAGVILAEL
jgi:glycosyltransferase involved in cell wall biosynthesis